MARVFCFGDSNTYGYDARSMPGERLPAGRRWPDILQKLSGWEVINGGMNGRVIPQTPWALKDFGRQLQECGPVDLVLIMLGSNDLLNASRPDMEEIGACMEQFIRHVLELPAVDGKGGRVLLIAPPPTDIGRFQSGCARYDREAGKFGSCYKEIAGRYALRFADAAGWELSLAHDGVHFTPESHVRFAERLWLLFTPGYVFDWRLNSNRLWNLLKSI